MSIDSEAHLIQTGNLQNFFRERIEHAADMYHLDSDSDTLWYLTQLLCNYANTDCFLDKNKYGTTLTPLAEYYRLAMESQTKHERRLILQKLGDVAMVVTGLFSGALKRKPVGIDYYVSMGEAAYGTLADESAQTTRDKALKGIFQDLANDFNNYVAVLSAVPQSQHTETDLLAMVDEWQVNQHPAMAKKLRSLGVFIEPLSQPDPKIMH